MDWQPKTSPLKVESVKIRQTDLSTGWHQPSARRNLHFSGIDDTKRNYPSPMQQAIRNRNETDVMATTSTKPAPGKGLEGTRSPKQSRLLGYQRENPMPLRYQDRLSYDIPNQTENLGKSSTLYSPYLGPQQESTHTVPTRRLNGKHNDYETRHPMLPRDDRMRERDRNSSCQSESRLSSKETGFQNSFTKDENWKEAISFYSNVLRLESQANHLYPEFQRPQNINQTAQLDSGFTRHLTRSGETLLTARNADHGCNPERFSFSAQRYQNGEEFKTRRTDTGQDHNEVYTAINSNSAIRKQGKECLRTETARVQGYFHDNFSEEKSQHCNEIFLSDNQGLRNMARESSKLQRTAGGDFSTPNGAIEDRYLISDVKAFNGSSKSHCRAPKSCIVREFNSDEIKRNLSQRGDNRRSLVQFALTGTGPSKEKEADNIITLIDESFTDYYADKRENKTLIRESPRNDSKIRSVNRRTENEVAEQSCYTVRESSNEDAGTPSRNEQGRKENCVEGRTDLVDNDELRNTSLQVSLSSGIITNANHSRNSQATADRSSFEEIRKQLFIEARLSEEGCQDRKTNPDELDLSLVRTVYQDPSDNKRVEESERDGDVVFVVNNSSGHFVYNDDKNPYKDSILKTPKSQLRRNRDIKSPFIRTIYQDCSHGSASDKEVNTSGRPVSPFSDTVISATANCSSDQKRDVYMRLRRRDRKLRYLSEPGRCRIKGKAFITDNMDAGCSVNGDAVIDKVLLKDVTVGSSELTENALRAHTMALKASSPNIRRRPTLDQFFGKIEEHALMDSSSDTSEISTQSDSVLMIQKANKFNLTPVSGLVKDGTKYSTPSSRAKRLKAWKSRHEKVCKNTRPSASELLAICRNADELQPTETLVATMQEFQHNEEGVATHHEKSLVSQEVTCTSDNGILPIEKEISCSLSASNGFEASKNQPHFDSIIDLPMKNICNQAEENLVCKTTEEYGIDLNGNFDKVNVNDWTTKKSLGSEDSFEEVFVEPELLSCSPSRTRPLDDKGTLLDGNISTERKTPDIKSKHDSLDVFVGSASAILERVRRLQLKYNHRTNIPCFGETDQEMGEFITGSSAASSSDKGLDVSTETAAKVCKESPTSEVLTVPDFANSQHETGFHISDKTGPWHDECKTNRPFKVRVSKKSSCSLEELRPEFGLSRMKSPCFSSEEDLRSSKENGFENKRNSKEIKNLLRGLDGGSKILVGETREGIKSTIEDENKGETSTLIDGINDQRCLKRNDVYYDETQTDIAYWRDVFKGNVSSDIKGHQDKILHINEDDMRGSPGLSENSDQKLRTDRDRKFECETERLETISLQPAVLDEGEESFKGQAVVEKEGSNKEYIYLEGQRKQWQDRCIAEDKKIEQQPLSYLKKVEKNDFKIEENCYSTSGSKYQAELQENVKAVEGCQINAIIKEKVNDESCDKERRKEGDFDSLSDKWEKASENKEKEISRLIERKDNIESHAFLHRGEGQPSKDNSILTESKKTSTGLVKDSCELSDKEKVNSLEADLKPTKVLEDTDVQQIFDFELFATTRISKGENLLEKGNESENDVIEFHNEDNSEAIRQKLGDNERYKLTAIDDTDLEKINSAEAGFSVEECDLVMAQGKGVSDLKRCFEKRQLGQESADDKRTIINQKQQVPDSRENRDGDKDFVKINIKPSPSKIGALKSMFESSKEGSMNPKTPLVSRGEKHRMASPKFVRSPLSVKEGLTKETTNPSFRMKSPTREASKKSNADEETRLGCKGKEGNKPMDSKEPKDDVTDFDFRSEVLRLNAKIGSPKDENRRKSPKVPPPIKRKPSLKKNNEGLKDAEGNKKVVLSEKMNEDVCNVTSCTTAEEKTEHEMVEPAATINVNVKKEISDDTNAEKCAYETTTEEEQLCKTRCEPFDGTVEILEVANETDKAGELFEMSTTNTEENMEFANKVVMKEQYTVSKEQFARPNISGKLVENGDKVANIEQLNYGKAAAEVIDGFEKVGDLNEHCTLSEKQTAEAATTEERVEHGGKVDDTEQLCSDKIEDRKIERQGEVHNTEAQSCSEDKNNLFMKEKKEEDRDSEEKRAEEMFMEREELLDSCRSQEENVIFCSKEDAEINAGVNIPEEILDLNQEERNLNKEQDLGQLITESKRLTTDKSLADYFEESQDRAQTDRSNGDSSCKGSPMETRLFDQRPKDTETEITFDPISGSMGSSNPVKKEHAETEGNIEPETSSEDRVVKVKELNSVEVAQIGTEKQAEMHALDARKTVKQKLPPSRSYSNSSDSSFEDTGPVIVQNIDFERLPKVGLPALLKENTGRSDTPEWKRDVEVHGNETSDGQEQQQNHDSYISYSSKASDMWSHAAELGMYTKAGSKGSDNMTVSADLKTTLVSDKQQQQPESEPLSRKTALESLDTRLEMIQNEAAKLGIISSSLEMRPNASPVKLTSSDFPVNESYKSTKSFAPMVIQSQPLTSDRSGLPNVAKVSPYFHDSSCRKFAEPIRKFGGFWEDEHTIGTNYGDDHGNDNLQIGYSLKRNTGTQGNSFERLRKLNVLLKTKKECQKENVVDIGVISVDGMKHWIEIEEEVIKTFMFHIKQIDYSCLGITSKDVKYLQIGRHQVAFGAGKDLRHFSMEDVEINAAVELHGDWLDSVALLAYQSLIPKQILEKYLSMAINHHCLIFCGPSGTGKSYIANKIADALALRIGENENNNILEPIHTINVNAEQWKEIKKTIVERISQSLPIVVVIDGFSPEFQEGVENLSLFLKQVANKNVYVIAALNQANAQEVTVKWQNTIRWIWLDNNEEPVCGLLTRYLRKKFLNSNQSSECEELFKIGDWISSLWKQLNLTIEQFHSAEQSIGPAMFFSCPTNESEIEEWFFDLWKYSLAPYMLHTMRTGLKLFGQRCDWHDPVEWIMETYPWQHKEDLVTKLKRIRKEDVGYRECSSVDCDISSSSGNQIRLMNFLRRLETLVENKKITTDTKPGTTQRRIYLESTL